ncbi:DUF2029 domain-containing protein [Corynebacterium poyangense]|uniref:DUF2029 domain-containing protein n=1 Tax=Corynebacterium poyangense TaxID=2684405 RepID=A0A7H0SNH2_9CORY|nr:glycosyltransferase 87 family protein [Corynebacterium poyangense]MBZ8177127.1 DUF2029 domain-containing protein [Corynebacterium poyangense]QNQ90097.1 DUF2029 domain-containing protein [Corynebacterium poyangense]
MILPDLRKDLQNRRLTQLGVLLFAVGVAITIAEMFLTRIALDAAIYRRGVVAYLHDAPLYSNYIQVGDVSLPFIYPPFGALFLSPLGFFPISDSAAGYTIVILTSLLLLICTYILIRQLFSDYPPRSIALMTAGTWAVGLALEPIRLNNHFGQINVILMALVVLDILPRKRTLPQGWLIGIAAAIKISPLAMLLFFLLKKDLRPIITAGISGIIATILATIFRPNIAKEYFSVLSNIGLGGEIGVDPTYTSNSSLKAVVMRWFPSRSYLESAEGTAILNTVWVILVLLTIALGAWLILQLLRRGWDTEAWLTNAVIMLLISPISWSHHWVWLALLLPVSLIRICRTPAHSRPLALVTTLWFVLCLTVPPKWWFGDGIDVFTLPWYATILVSDYVWLAIAWLIALWWLVRHEPTTISKERSVAN